MVDVDLFEKTPWNDPREMGRVIAEHLYDLGVSATRSVPRMKLEDVPTQIRAALEHQLGSAIAEHQSQEEGFSPGVAAPCTLEDGRRCFVKAVNGSTNTDSLLMGRHEVAINKLLPGSAPSPELWASVSSGDWVAAAWCDVDGRSPQPVWDVTDLSDVLAAVAQLDLSPVVGAAPLTKMFESVFRGWRDLAVVAQPDVEPWIDTTVLYLFAQIEAGWQDACPPDRLVHADIRGDNIIIDRERKVWIVDWANAALGPAWFDTVAMIPAIAMDRQDLSAARIWAMSPLSPHVDPAEVDAIVVAIAGYFTAQARKPPVPAIPMLRDFQEAPAAPARQWARERLGL